MPKQPALLSKGLDFEFDRDQFKAMVADAHVEQLIDDLEVRVSDHVTIFDAIDANGNGLLNLHELVEGLLRLRGSTDKTDVVAALLTTRDVQQSLRSMKVDMDEGLRMLWEMQMHLEQRIESAMPVLAQDVTDAAPPPPLMWPMAIKPAPASIPEDREEAA